MIPDVGWQRRDVQIAHQHGAPLRIEVGAKPFGQRRQELEFVGEFGVDFGIRNAAAGRHIQVVQLELARKPQAQVPTVVLAAPGDRFASSSGSLENTATP